MNNFHRRCPVDASWSQWLPWRTCTPSCVQEGGRVPTKTRFRQCNGERFGGKNCSTLFEETEAKNLPARQERQNCPDMPNCPVNAKSGEWTEWSACTRTCYNETEHQPQQTRVRPCIPGIPSSDEVLNIDIITCETLGEPKENRGCSIHQCPGIKTLEIFFLAFAKCCSGSCFAKSLDFRS